MQNANYLVSGIIALVLLGALALFVHGSGSAPENSAHVTLYLQGDAITYRAGVPASLLHAGRPVLATFSPEDNRGPPLECQIQCQTR